MALEVANWIKELVPANPVPSDVIGEGDDHIRTTKLVLENTFKGDLSIPDEWDSSGGALLVGPIFLTSLKGLGDGTYNLTLVNEKYLTGRNFADSGNINLIKANASDEVEIGAALVVPSIVAAGDITAFSDIALKSNLEPIANALDKISVLVGYTYDKDEKRNAGLIANDVEVVLPEAVGKRDGMRTLNQASVMGLVVNAINELREKVNDLTG
jgi:hypothetical protein